MTTLVDAVQGFTENFETDGEVARGWLGALRARGMSAFQAQGFPTTRLEEWRDTNVAPIAQTRFVMPKSAPGGGASQAAIDVAHGYSFGNQAAAELVFINGFFEPHLSTASNLPKGVRVLSLERALESDSDLLEKHLGHYANIDAHPFAALNTSFVRQGALVHIAAGTIAQKPIHLLFLTIPTAQPAASHPRVLVIAEENSACSIVETYAAGEGTGLYLTNAVTEIVQAPGSRIDHNKLQQEGLSAYHTALLQVNLATRSSFISHSSSLGSKLTRNDLQVYLGGEHAEATLNGLVYAKGDQHIDNHTLLHHEKAHCPSHELYKHVLDGHATGVFKGKIFVQKDAQKTDSKQTTKSLLLSDSATMNSQPALEIYADDVKCTHGSTIGPVDENAIFYLVSRGLSLHQARHLMTYAFAADITRRIKIAAVRTRIEDFMAVQHGLPQDLRITEEAAHDVALL